MIRSHKRNFIVSVVIAFNLFILWDVLTSKNTIQADDKVQWTFTRVLRIEDKVFLLACFLSGSLLYCLKVSGEFHRTPVPAGCSLHHCCYWISPHSVLRNFIFIILVYLASSRMKSLYISLSLMTLQIKTRYSAKQHKARHKSNRLKTTNIF